MKQCVDIHTLLPRATDKDQKIAYFALLSLGVIESLAGGAISASRAVQMFFNADNCLWLIMQFRLVPKLSIGGIPDSTYTPYPHRKAGQEVLRN